MLKLSHILPLADHWLRQQAIVKPKPANFSRRKTLKTDIRAEYEGSLNRYCQTNQQLVRLPAWGMRRSCQRLLSAETKVDRIKNEA